MISIGAVESCLKPPNGPLPDDQVVAGRGRLAKAPVPDLRIGSAYAHPHDLDQHVAVPESRVSRLYQS